MPIAVHISLYVMMSVEACHSLLQARNSIQFYTFFG